MDLKLNINFDALPPLHKKLLLFAPPVVIIALAVYLFIMPGMDELTKLRDEADKQNKEIAELKTKTAGLGAVKAENDRLKARLMELQQKLPEEKEVSGLLKQVSELGIQSGMEIVLWRPRARTVHPSKDVYEIPVDVQMKGSYHNLGRFLAHIAGLGRTILVGNIGLSPEGKTGAVKGVAPLKISFNATTYSIISELEKQAMEAKEAKDAKDKDKKK